MKKIVLDTNCLLMSIPKISPYRIIWDEFIAGKLTFCVTNEIIKEYLEILTEKTNYEIACNVVSVILKSAKKNLAHKKMASVPPIGIQEASYILTRHKIPLPHKAKGCRLIKPPKRYFYP